MDHKNSCPLKALLAGIIVYTIGSYPSLIIISIVPFPASAILLLLYLFIYIKYFSGNWGDKTSAFTKARSKNFRALRIPGNVFWWGLIGALLFVVWQQSLWEVTFRIFEYDPEVMETFHLGDLPLVILWFASIASALIAGISEEVGFRGYMQVPMENRYKPWVANVFVSVFFLIFHLNQGWAEPSMFVLLFGSSILIGMLTMACGSLIPGIIAHFLVDIFNFTYWWSDLAGSFDLKPITETGIDTHFVLWLISLVISLFLFLLVTRKTKKERLRSPEAETGSI
jgi:membrane protease YdiL (CAAX protease family)